VLSSRDGKPTVLSQDRSFFRLSAKDFDDPPGVLARIALPRSGSSRSARYRRDVAAKLVSLHVRTPRAARPPADPSVERAAAELEAQAAAHPCAACPELAKHERWAIRVGKLRSQLQGVERAMRARTETLARQFDRVLSVLEELGYVKEWTLSERGRLLTRIYGEGDLLVGEALATGLFDGLEPSEVASLLSAIVYESRERVPTPGEMPTERSAQRFAKLERVYGRIRRAEDRRDVALCRQLDAGFAIPVFHWAEGKPLEDVLAETELAPGDFVRNCKQLLDLLRQVEDVASPETSRLVREARGSVFHGVVAYTGV